jgi:hypothetical protein
MNAQAQPVVPGAGHLYTSRLVRPARPGSTYAVPVPATPLLAHALPHVDWSDAYAVLLPGRHREVHPQEWADAVFHSPPLWVRVLLGVREAAVGLVGIQRGGAHAFDTVSWTSNEVLLGIDQDHLAFRASVLVEPGRVVVSTVVEIRNRRGLAYSALVRLVHPFVVRGMLARAARTMAVAS